MTLTAADARGISGVVTNSSDILTIGRRLKLSDLIAEFKATVNLTAFGVSVLVETGDFYELELA